MINWLDSNVNRFLDKCDKVPIELSLNSHFPTCGYILTLTSKKNGETLIIVHFSCPLKVRNTLTLFYVKFSWRRFQT